MPKLLLRVFFLSTLDIAILVHFIKNRLINIFIYTGIADYATAPDLSENIGIATFGEQTRVVHHLTNDYSKLLETLGMDQRTRKREIEHHGHK